MPQMEGESSNSESEAEASDDGDDMEVEAVIRTVLVKAPRYAWARHKRASNGLIGWMLGRAAEKCGKERCGPSLMSH
jgi:hypothetical protein